MLVLFWALAFASITWPKTLELAIAWGPPAAPKAEAIVDPAALFALTAPLQSSNTGFTWILSASGAHGKYKLSFIWPKAAKLFWSCLHHSAPGGIYPSGISLGISSGISPVGSSWYVSDSEKYSLLVSLGALKVCKPYKPSKPYPSSAAVPSALFSWNHGT